MRPHGRIAWAGFVLLLFGLIPLAYFTHRSESAQVLGLYSLAFGGYLIFSLRAPVIEWRHLITLAIAFRLLLLFAPISWTDDHFRYIWDGWCSVNGIQPFAHTPRELLQLRPELFAADHFALLNSPEFHTVYPPFAQAFFALAAYIGQGDVGYSTLALRAFFLGCELGSMLLLRALLRDASRSQCWWMHYALNPLVLMELTVNLHTEALMIPLCLGALLLHKRGWLDASAVLLGLAASARLWPLLFILALPAVMTWRTSIRYGAIVALVFGIGWLPLWTTGLVGSFVSSLKLFGNYLEFNGGLYELLRTVIGSEAVKGTGLLAVVTLIALLGFSVAQWRKRNIPFAGMMFWLLFVYFLGSQAVHPWYILPLLAFGMLTQRWWPVAWTLLIVPTYLTYGSEPFVQPYAWVGLEYVLLIALVFVEERVRVKRDLHMA